MFKTHPQKPWLTIDGIFLLFDFVHLLKSIRNNWLTEKTGEIIYHEDEKTFMAKWSDLLQLYKLEYDASAGNSGGLNRMKYLLKVAVGIEIIVFQN